MQGIRGCLFAVLLGGITGVSGYSQAVSNPIFSPNGGISSTARSISISCTTAGSSVHYTLDGSTPTAASPSYAAPLSIAHSLTLKAVATAPGLGDSAVASASYLITGQIVGGRYHTLALKSDGTVWGAGHNTEGELGDGTTLERDGLVRTGSLTGIVALASGSYHGVALKNDGTVWVWGLNSSGQLGDGTTATRLTPVAVPGLANVIAISAGAYHTVALKSDGTVWSWGVNSSGQLGDGTTMQRNSPVQVSGLANVATIFSGEYHNFALKSDGTVWAWGQGKQGQLGLGTYVNQAIPVQVTGLTGVTALAGGNYHTVALKADGTVWAWGSNLAGQLGLGTTASNAAPVQVPGLSGIVSVVAGESFSTALKADGTVLAWGYDNDDELGDGGGPNRLSPAPVAGLSGMIALGAGQFNAFVEDGNGVVRGWGMDNIGSLAQGLATVQPLPDQLLSLSGVASLSAGASHSLAVKKDGTLWAWGANGSGQLGDGTTIGHAVPFQTATGVGTASAGTAHTLIVTTGGTVRACGNNSHGELGIGNLTTQTGPVTVPSLSGIVAVAAGGTHSLALKGDGTVWSWGSNANGQLGNAAPNSLLPAMMTGMAGAIAIAAGQSDSLVLKSDGTVWVWGDGYHASGAISGLSGVVAIAAGGSNCAVLKSDGTVWAWGANGSGQLGQNNRTESAAPVRVGSLANIVAIGLGQAQLYALRGDGTVWACGYNTKGCLGDGTLVARSLPVQAVNVGGIVQISAGNGSHVLALKEDGAVLDWGLAADGELGTNIGVARGPVPLVGLNLVQAAPTLVWNGPATGSVSALGQLLALQVTAAAGTAPLAQVDYYVDGTKIGTSTAAPYTLNWTPATWGNHNLSAVATDTQGATSLRTASVSLNVPYDSDGNGLPDWWELKYFGHLGNDPASSPAGNGLTLLQDYQQGNDPTNYYSQNGQIIAPLLTITGGNNQSSAVGTFASQALSVQVTDSHGAGLANAPLLFAVAPGGGGLALTNVGAPTTNAVLSLRADGTGLAAVFYQQPASVGASQINATTANLIASFTETAVSAVAPFSPPENLAATPGRSGEIGPPWTNTALTATYIVIQQSTDGTAWTDTVSLNDPTATSYTVTGLNQDQGYLFRVAAGK